MNVLIFCVGLVIFILFVISTTWEVRNTKEQEELDYQYYYERHSLRRIKQPKIKKGSQSRTKNYFWKK